MPSTQIVSPPVHTASEEPDTPRPGPSSYRRILLAALTLLVCTLAFQHTTALVPRPSGRFTEDVLYMRGLFRFYVTLCGGFLVAWLLQPEADALLESLRSRLSPRGKRLVTASAVATTCAFTAGFLIHFGRRHFGAWDYCILTDVAYRGFLGQRPFVDFVTPTPPFFNWSSTLAFRLFGVTWDATLFLAAIFSAVTLVWSFFLLRGLGLRSFAALATAFCMQAAAMLSCCFWWYNNTTLILAALFFFASLLLARAPTSRLAQVSFVLLFGLLPLTKPNIAGVTLAGCVLLLFASSKRAGRVVLLTVAGAALACLLFAAMHVSVPAMIASYRGIAKERGGLSIFGFEELGIGERQMTVFWFLALSLPLFYGVLRIAMPDLRNRRWRSAATWLFFPLAAVVAAYGIAGNGEFRDVEFPLMIGGLALLAFRFLPPHTRLGRLIVALLCAMAASDLYCGAARLRVYTMRPHVFFEWQDDHHRFDSGFLAHLRGSQALVDVDQQVRVAAQTNPGPIFFGPRLEFEYAVLGLPSPTHWVTFFQPGTAFGREQTPAILQAWVDHHFSTLVFLKGDYIFYPDTFKDFLRTHFLRDDHFTRVTVYRRRPFS